MPLLHSSEKPWSINVYFLLRLENFLVIAFLPFSYKLFSDIWLNSFFKICFQGSFHTVDNLLKGALSGLRIFGHWKPFKNNDKCFFISS